MTNKSQLAVDRLRRIISIFVAPLTRLKTAVRSKRDFKEYIKTRDSDSNGRWSWENEGEPTYCLLVMAQS